MLKTDVRIKVGICYLRHKIFEHWTVALDEREFASKDVGSTCLPNHRTTHKTKSSAYRVQALLVVAFHRRRWLKSACRKIFEEVLHFRVNRSTPAINNQHPIELMFAYPSTPSESPARVLPKLSSELCHKFLLQIAAFVFHVIYRTVCISISSTYSGSSNGECLSNI